MSVELKPCPAPWCDGQPVLLVAARDMRIRYYACVRCGLCGRGTTTSVEDAAAAWNHRPRERTPAEEAVRRSDDPPRKGPSRGEDGMRRLLDAISRAWWAFWVTLRRPASATECVALVERPKPPGPASAGDGECSMCNAASGGVRYYRTVGNVLCITCATGVDRYLRGPNEVAS